MIYASKGTVTLKGTNVIITGNIIAKNIIIDADCVNFNILQLNDKENLSQLQLFLADMVYDKNNKINVLGNDLLVMKKKILGIL